VTLIAQITDPHLRDDGADPSHDPALALRRAFERIAGMKTRPDAIALTGDVIDRSAAGYGHVIDMLRTAPVRVLPLSGNHDRAAGFRAAFGGWAGFAEEHLSFVEPVGAALLVGLDSTLDDGKGGVDATRLDWLERVLGEADAPVILALHHPPFPTLAPHIDDQGFAGADALAARIAGSRVCRVIAGHSHRGIQTLWAGVAASTCSAIGFGLGLSLSGAAHRPVATPPGYELHLLRSGAVVTHQVTLD